MCDLNLTRRSREEIEYAISQWKCGEEEHMMDLLNNVQAEAFADGCCYMREHVIGILNMEREEGTDDK